MPFDGLDLVDNHPLAKLGAVERLLANEDQWCKGRLRDAHGRHCLVGAIEAVEGRQTLQRVVLHAAREVSGKRYWRIEFFNDDPRTTHADVLAVLQRARENIIAGMICSPQPWRRRWLRALRASFSYTRDGGVPHFTDLSESWPPVDPPFAVQVRGGGGADVRKEKAAVLELQA